MTNVMQTNFASLQLIHKIRNGLRVEDAVEEIVDRGVNELRKKAFGEDEEESKHLPWTREQAWKIVRLLSEQSEVRYTCCCSSVLVTLFSRSHIMMSCIMCRLAEKNHLCARWNVQK